MLWSFPPRYPITQACFKSLHIFPAGMSFVPVSIAFFKEAGLDIMNSSYITHIISGHLWPFNLIIFNCSSLIILKDWSAHSLLFLFRLTSASVVCIHLPEVAALAAAMRHHIAEFLHADQLLDELSFEGHQAEGSFSARSDSPPSLTGCCLRVDTPSV